MPRTFGTLTFDGAWIVHCEPQVLLRARRFFASIGNRTFEGFSLADTIENARELEWFFERYPVRMDSVCAERLKIHADEHRALADTVWRVLSEDYIPKDYALAKPPYLFQRIAADLAVTTGRLLVADDVGLGKTITAIAVMTSPGALPACVVVPSHMPRHWVEKINEFAPGMRTYIAPLGDVRLPKQFPDVVVINYHKLAKWVPFIKGQFRTVIFDEAQDLRRVGSDKYYAATCLAEGARIGLELSATPIYNQGSEIHNVLNIIAPNAIGTHEEFTREWCRNGGDFVSEPKALGSYLREQGLMIRRTRAEVGRELPGLIKVPYTIDADLAAIKEIEGRAAELASIILAQQGVLGWDRMQASEELDWRLRQATGVAKAPYVAEFVRLLVESGEHVVLYGWHRDVYAIWMEKLRDLAPVLYTGSESPNQKEKAKAAFIGKSTPILIVSLRSGQGMDGLQAVSRTVVFGELDWSPAVHEQCIGRVFRDGQADPVTAYYLISEHGSDPIVADVLGVKRAQLEGIINPTADLVADAQLDPDRIRKLAEGFLKQHGDDRKKPSQNKTQKMSEEREIAS